MTNREFQKIGAPEGWRPPYRKRTRTRAKKRFDVPGSVGYGDLDLAFPDGIDPEDPAQMSLLSDECRARLDEEARKGLEEDALRALEAGTGLAEETRRAMEDFWKAG